MDIYPLNPPKNIIRLLGELSPINPMHQHEAQCPLWGILRGAFPLATAKVVTAVVCVL